FINSKSNIKPKIGLILGSGLGDLANDIEDPVTIKYSEIPNFPALADVVKKDVEFGELNSQDKDMRYTIHSTLKKVTADLSEKFGF
ncbi:hypothetical protein ACTPEF_25040, partial [Clostridioides difficile]